MSNDHHAKGCSEALGPAVSKTFDLDPAEWLILWGVRYWVACHCGGRESRPLLSDVFGRNRVADAALCLDAVLRLTCLAAERTLDIRCPACPEISSDEQAILSAIGCAQRGDNPGSLRLLRGWLPAAAARMALQMFVGLAQILADAGYHLRNDAARRSAHALAAGAGWGAAGPIH